MGYPRRGYPPLLERRAQFPWGRTLRARPGNKSQAALSSRAKALRAWAPLLRLAWLFCSPSDIAFISRTHPKDGRHAGKVKTLDYSLQNVSFERGVRLSSGGHISRLRRLAGGGRYRGESSALKASQVHLTVEPCVAHGRCVSRRPKGDPAMGYPVTRGWAFRRSFARRALP